MTMDGSNGGIKLNGWFQFVRENGKTQKWNKEKPIIADKKRGKEVAIAFGKLVEDVVAGGVAKVGM